MVIRHELAPAPARSLCHGGRFFRESKHLAFYVIVTSPRVLLLRVRFIRCGTEVAVAAEESRGTRRDDSGVERVFDRTLFRVRLPRKFRRVDWTEFRFGLSANHLGVVSR